MPAQPRECRARVAAVRTLARGVREADLALVEPPGLAFDAGQWVSVPVATKTVRAYSLASLPSVPHQITLCADVAPGGLGSRWFSELTVGAEVRFKGPLGGFVYGGTETRRPILVAEEIGIVPIRAIALALAERGALCSGTLLYVWPDAGRLVYDAELQSLARRVPGFHYRPLTGMAFGGAVDAALAALADIANSAGDVVAYVAGGQAMIKRVRELLVSHGLDRKSVRWERFW